MFACRDEPAPIAQVVVAIQTDVALPDSVDALRLEVSTEGRLVLGNDYAVGAGRQLIPATLGILRGPNPSAPVLIRLIAKKAGVPKMVRDVVTTIPPRIIAVRVPIRWLCDESAKVSSPGSVESICPSGQTCIGGECLDAAVDGSQAPDYLAADVFGGGTGTGDGTCFDVVGCLSPSNPVVPDEACTIPRPAGAQLNVALGVENDGICDDTKRRCFVILDKGIGGWQEAGDRVRLPRAVCSRIATGRVKSVVTSGQCATKTERDPVCGSWSSVGRPRPAPGPEGGAVSGAALVTETGFLFTTAGGGCKPALTGRGLVFCGLDSSNQRSRTFLQPLDGSASRTLAEIPTTNLVLGPFPDTNETYWVENTGTPELLRMGHDGTPPMTVSTFALSSLSANATVDAQAVYVTTRGDFGVDEKPLYAVPKNGAPAYPLASGLSVAGLSPRSVVADTSPTGFVYVGTAPDFSGGPAARTIERFAKTATDAGAARVFSVPGAASDLVLDGDDLWFASSEVVSTGGIYKLSLTTGSAALVASSPGLVTEGSLAVDGTDVYFVANRSPTDPTRAVFRVSKAGGALRTVATQLAADVSAEAVVPAPTQLYITASRYGANENLAGFLFAVPK